MKILFAISLLLFLTSCEVEKLEPNDVIEEAPPGWNPASEPVDPASIVVPCALQPNLVRFNNANTTISSVSVNPPFLSVSESTYSIRLSLVSSQDLEMFFLEEPATGYYTTTIDLDPNFETRMHARVFTGGSYYTCNTGADVYVQNYGDSIRISYCDIDFTNSFTIPNSKGQFVY